jgi:hypothetical protein
MKKIFLILSILFINQTLKAQEEVAALKNFRVGIKATPTISWTKPEDSKLFIGGGARVRFGYGLVTEFKLNKVVSFFSGLEFNSYGAKFEIKDTTLFYQPDDQNLQPGQTSILYKPTKRSVRINYFEIPLALKMRTPEINGITYFANFGFNLGFRGKALADDEGQYITTSSKIEVINNVSQTVTSVAKRIEDRPDLDVKKDYSPLRIALNVGGGLEYKLVGSTAAFASLSYINGFTNLLKSSSKELSVIKNNSVSFAQTSAKLSGVMLSVGVMF